MNGTCVETPPQHAEGEDEPVVFSFFSDIAHNSTIIELVQNISKTVQNTLGSLNKYLSRWKRYRVLWKLDKVSLCLLRLMQVVDFSGLMQVCHSVASSLWISSSLWKSDVMHLDVCRLAASCWNSLHQACGFHQVYENQTWCILMFADLLQVVETACIKLVDFIKSMKIRPDASWCLQTCCKLLKRLASSLWISSSLWKSDLMHPDVCRLAASCWNGLHQACGFHQVYENQTWCILMFAELLQVVETACIKLVDFIKSMKIRPDASWCLQTCSKLLKQLASSLWISSSLWKSDLMHLDVCRVAASCWNNLHQACGFHQVYENQTWCILMFADLLQVVETACIKLVDFIKSMKIRPDASWCLQTCSKLLKQLASSLWILSSLWKSDLMHPDVCRLAASCWNGLHQACGFHQVYENQTWCILMFADLLQVVETTGR